MTGQQSPSFVSGAVSSHSGDDSAFGTKDGWSGQRSLSLAHATAVSAGWTARGLDKGMTASVAEVSTLEGAANSVKVWSTPTRASLLDTTSQEEPDNTADRTAGGGTVLCSGTTGDNIASTLEPHQKSSREHKKK